MQLPPEWLETPSLDRSRALAAPLYVAPEVLALERDAVFAKSWQLVAHGGEVAEPGDHTVADVAGRPILVVRGADRVLRAFHNVCRHRAGPIALEPGRGARTLRCRYHGWTYGLDGVLRNAPEMDGACDFVTGDVRLPEVQVAEWQQLVFVALAAGVPPLAELLAGSAERAAPNGAAALTFHHRTRYEVACNWKTYVDNYLEGYHLPHVHPSLSRVLDYKSYTTEVHAWSSLQSSPLRGSQGLYASGAEALYYFVYPNTMLNILPGRLQTNRVLPLRPERCRVDFDFFYAPGAPAAAEDEAFSDAVQAEDIGICEAVQKGLASGSYLAGRLSPLRESALVHFHDRLRDAYRATT